ncbi:hypothetical protein PVA45_05870 [Entomospira entomophila]|uniref:Uncharacterized protein n=1 Tax=Entomospira entomophila TaxID=2719988 RepID=A0A968KWQ0_9SPIO|nr:hypothetical protein [Entomospira entomophilus]NIZ41025.1 hypothetical protein [Entomospira entomophilus]WDI35237.1 hypothetical protein PVA45_05870 [Entomospira entomophilus]
MEWSERGNTRRDSVLSPASGNHTTYYAPAIREVRREKMREEKYQLSLINWEENNPKWLAYLAAHDPEDNFFIEELCLTTKARDGIYDPYGNKVEGLTEDDERLTSYLWHQFEYPMQHDVKIHLNWEMDWDGIMTTLSRRHLGMLDFHAKEMTLVCRRVCDFSYYSDLLFLDHGVNVHLLEIRKNDGYNAIELSINEVVKVTCDIIDITVKFKEESDLIITDN